MIHLRDASGADLAAVTEVRVTLRSSSARAGFAKSAEAEVTQPLTLVIPAGDSSALVYYRDWAEGSVTLTASSPGIGDGTVTIEVWPAPLTACGCGASGSWASLLGLLGLVALPRRRQYSRLHTRSAP